MRSIFHFLPSTLVRLGVSCHGMWGDPMKCVRVRSFFFSMTISNFLSCDRLGPLCMFAQPVFHFLPCSFIWSGTKCRAMWGRPMKHVWVGSFRLRVAVSNFLSCDHPGALCSFVQLVFHFLYCNFVLSGASCLTCEGAWWNTFSLACFIWGWLYKIF